MRSLVVIFVSAFLLVAWDSMAATESGELSNKEFSVLGEQMVEVILRGAAWNGGTSKSKDCWRNSLPNIDVISNDAASDFKGDDHEKKQFNKKFLKLKKYEIVDTADLKDKNPYKFNNDEKNFEYSFIILSGDKAVTKKNGKFVLGNKNKAFEYTIKGQLYKPTKGELKKQKKMNAIVQGFMVMIDTIDAFDEYLVVKTKCTK